ncbi:hypothetical protein BV898_11761 [Hypsibius exemplaris]|uniref:Sushi domain-containing protein n=1 Tax=Hypsibius exemplaris TaxID=2072580 RepID=A0A1W0WFM1_HYPEX|nr:hypothetical protein BV898_11761 [Hypsibius exemplaris]
MAGQFCPSRSGTPSVTTEKHWSCSDFTDDFIRVQQLWCKFTFPLKPPTNGLYPYYQRCHVRNITDTFHCYDPLRHNLTSDTFMTALQSSNLNFNSYRLTGIDLVSPYKCCKTPPGYYIDYVSCYYMPTHDAYFEYYDSPNNFIVYCSQGYVMTGMAKKINPFTGEWRHDWIQCCRVGFGTPRQAHPPPVSYMPSGVPAYRSDISEGSGAIPAAYQPQYRTTSKEADDIDGSRPRRKDLISAGLFGQEEEERLSIVKADPRRPTLKRLIANGVSL